MGCPDCLRQQAMLTINCSAPPMPRSKWIITIGTADASCVIVEQMKANLVVVSLVILIYQPIQSQSYLQLL